MEPEQFGWPASIALDGSGNVYVADGGNSEIRMVTPSGSVTTLAGSWQVSGTIDGAGTAAQFNYPNGIAFDPTSGNLFVADSYNNTIRKVTLSGTVTTLAGTPGVSGSADGLGTAAQFNNPTGVAVDADGNIYVADEGNSTIRKVTPAGEVTTIGGTPTVTGTANGIGSVAGFNLPFGVAVNAAGNVYVADTLNNRITIGLPQQVTGSTSSFNSTVGAVVSGSANPNGNAATVWFDYGPTNSYGYTTGSQTIGSGSNFVSVISTLTGPTLGVPWHYCLAFTSSAGIFYGADQTINAPGYTVNPAVVASATSVVLSGTVNPNGVAGPAKSGSNVLVSWQYGLTSGSYMATTSVTPIGTGTTAVSVSFTLTKKLKPAIYHYQIVISSTLGIIYGPDQTFSVDPPTVASLPPPTATFSGASPSASVNPNGLDTTVSFEYGTTTAYGSYTTGTDIGSGTSPVTVTLPLTGLAPDMAYYYRTVTTNVSGTTYGPVQEFATQALYGTSAVLWTSGAAPGIPGATFSALGDPATNDSDHLAFQATITGSTVGITSANNSGIWADIGSNGLTLIVQTGSSAPGYGPASPLYTGPAVSVGNFATLSDPVYADSDAVAFLGTLTQTGTGIWATTSGTLALVAKAGDPAPDEYGNVSSSSPVFASFSQFVLPNQGGVIFLATLATGTGGVTSSNNVGIWAVDTTGILKQIIRAGNALTVNGVAKVISKVVIFNAPAASTGQTRHFNNPGDLTYVLTFTDKSSSIVQSVFP